MTSKQIRHIAVASVALWAIIGFGIAYAAANMWCLNGTTQCAFGTPSTSKLSLTDRAKSLYSMTVAQYNESATSKTFQYKTSNELIALAKAYLAPVVPPVVVPPVEPPVVVPPVTSLMPFVDKTKYITPSAGYNDLRVRNTSEQPTNKDGSFRISCLVSHMNNDDPLLYPNQEGRAHPHTFYGNTNVKYNTNLDTLSTVGNSTCDGGIMNRSAYWHPTMVAPGGIPVLADGGAIFYYKHGALPATSIKSPPKGLRMIAGNMHAKTAAESKSTIFWCINIALQHSNGMGKLRNIPACGTDTFLQMITTFPQCWDGKNLDSPNHQDHMAYPAENKCPSTHPVPIPEISLNLNYKVPSGGTGKWRLASDNYEWNGSNAGYSGHADWVNGWDQPFLDGIVKNCINAVKDCHAHLLGDGRMFYRNE